MAISLIWTKSISNSALDDTFVIKTKLMQEGQLRVINSEFSANHFWDPSNVTRFGENLANFIGPY